RKPGEAGKLVEVERTADPLAHEQIGPVDLIEPNRAGAESQRLARCRLLWHLRKHPAQPVPQLCKCLAGLLRSDSVDHQDTDRRRLLDFRHSSLPVSSTTERRA